MQRKITIEENWRHQSEAAKADAQKLPYGKERDALIKKARQLAMAFVAGSVAAKIVKLNCIAVRACTGY